VIEEAEASRNELRPFSADYRIHAADGRVIWIHDESVPIVDPHGRTELMQGYFVDITSRKELEQQLLHSQKTEELGRLTGQVAHDFNNYLAAILSSAELLTRRLAPDSEEAKVASEIVQSTELAAHLTRQLLAFGRRQHVEPQVVALADVVRGFEPVLQRIAGPGVALDFDLGEAPQVRVDPGRLEQVLVNLIANARDAMTDGGVVCIGTHATAVSAGGRAQRLDLAPGAYAVLAVSDTGPGMDEATKAQAFEPFFTTKGPELGTGLGLSIVDSVVRQAGGAIELDTEPGNGALFRIFLPAISG
jgi:two-component system cell cycle sensor histidine kinase/response regulator CckA